MRELLASVGEADSDSAAWLTVIDRFDSAMSESSDLHALVRLAAEVLDLEAGVRDDWHGVDFYEGSDPGGAGDRFADVSRELVVRRHRGRNSIEFDIGKDSYLACNIEIAQGRAGVAWARRSAEGSWRPLDYLVVERLAMASGQLALIERSKRMAEYRLEAGNLAGLLGGQQSEAEIKESLRQVSLQLQLPHLVIAVEQEPAGTLHPDTISAMVKRLAAQSGIGVRTAEMGMILAVVATDTSDTDDFLREFSVAFERSGVLLRLGVSDSTGVERLHTAWNQARTALALRSMVTGEPMVRHRELGVLSLLAAIPVEQVTSMALFSQLEEALATSEQPSNRDVLEAYLEENSLRKAASRVFLHYTSVESRLRRFSERLLVDLSDPSTRFQLLLLLKIRRVLEMQESSQL